MRWVFLESNNTWWLFTKMKKNSEKMKL